MLHRLFLIALFWKILAITMETNSSCTTSLGVLFQEYIQERRFCSHLSPETIRGYEAAFGLFQKLMPELTEGKLLRTEKVIEFFRRLETRQRKHGRKIKMGVKGSTVKTYWSKLNAFFEWLSHKSLQPNPLAGINPPQPVYEDTKVLNEEAVKKLYAAVTLHSKNIFLLRRDTAMISLFLFCGLRLGEFLLLEARDFDFEKLLLTIRSTNSKSGKTRYIPIHATLLFHLKDYISERNKRKYTTPYFIASTNGDRKLSKDGLKHWVLALSKKAGVKFHLHQLRHTFACNLAARDVNPVKIQKLLGHSSLNMTMSYLRSIDTLQLHDDINKMSI
jgi:integrase/recombinase XerD